MLYRPLVDAWWLYDASQLPPRLVAKEERRKLKLADASLYQQLAGEATEEANEA